LGCSTIFVVATTFNDHLQLPWFSVFFMFVAGGGLSLGLINNLAKQKVGISAILAYPQAKRRAVAAFAKLSEYAVAIEKRIPKRVEKLEFGKKSKLQEFDHVLLKNVES